MNNLFSVFDPVASFTPNWISTFLLITLLPCVYWAIPSPSMSALKTLAHLGSKELGMNFSTSNTPGHTHWCISLLILILINNVMGLTPYTFTSPSHLTFSLAMGLTWWTGYMLSSIIKDINHSLAHLVPMGTPLLLLPFMVIIETISTLIRPMTLSVRLTANLMAGHLLMTLSASVISISSPLTMMAIIVIVLLMVLETAVSCIQAYVFSMLSTLYLSEVNFNSLQA